MKDIRTLDKKKIELKDIEGFYKVYEYKELYEKVLELIDLNILEPIKSSKLNGKSPALHIRYKVIKKSEDNTEYINELNFDLNINLNINYYISNIEKYKEHREYILALSKFLDFKMDLLETQVSMNERSFQIWAREKFLQKEGGKTILKNLSLSEDYLNYYDTFEPLAYYCRHKETPQNLLIIENKDTFYTFRRHIINGEHSILGEDITTIIYGGGKNINKSFKDFKLSVEPHVSYEENNIYYLGDLDYEGIIIYEGLYKVFKDKYKIKPFIKGYKAMLDKYEKEGIILPFCKEGQNKNIGDEFINCFSEIYRNKILDILQSDKYIPQEILTIGDL